MDALQYLIVIMYVFAWIILPILAMAMMNTPKRRRPLLITSKPFNLSWNHYSECTLYLNPEVPDHPAFLLPPHTNKTPTTFVFCNTEIRPLGDLHMRMVADLKTGNVFLQDELTDLNPKRYKIHFINTADGTLATEDSRNILYPSQEWIDGEEIRDPIPIVFKTTEMEDFTLDMKWSLAYIN